MAKVNKSHKELPHDTIVEVISIWTNNRDRVYKKVMTFGEWKRLNSKGRKPGFEYHCYQLGRSAYKNVIEL